MLWLELLAPETIEVPPRPRFSRILLTFGRYKRHRTTEIFFFERQETA
jgi:hypothetical protein